MPFPVGRLDPRQLAGLRGSVKAERAKRSLWHFLRDFAWPVLQPATKFVDSWHIHAICEHLEAVTRGEIKRLIINMPFRALKSTIITQTWPAWEWIKQPSNMYLTGSYALKIAVRDSVYTRDIIESKAYQAAYGSKFRMSTDKNVKSQYENDKRGSRVSTSTESAGTGFGGNRLIVDDPVSSLMANSEIELNKSIEWYKGTAATRLNDPSSGAIVVVHQRLNVNDLTGYLLREQPDRWTQLILPMRFERAFSRVTSLGWKDPRTVEGELLTPHRLGEDDVKDMETTLGAYHTAAQLQQRPIIRGGTVLKSEWFPRWKVLPRLLYKRIYGDTAQKTKEANDYSVFQCWGLGDDGKIYLIDQVRGKWEALALEQTAKAFWDKHAQPQPFTANLGKMLIEDAASGTGLIQNLKKKAIPIEGITRSKDKLTRCYDGQAFMESGLVCLPETAYYLSDLCAEIDEFTKDDSHRHDDQIDPMLDAIADLLSKPKGLWDVL